jgi:hypothetical protein
MTRFQRNRKRKTVTAEKNVEENVKSKMFESKKRFEKQS